MAIKMEIQIDPFPVNMGKYYSAALTLAATVEFHPPSESSTPPSTFSSKTSSIICTLSSFFCLLIYNRCFTGFASNNKLALYKLLFTSLHRLRTHFWKAVHKLELLPTLILYTMHGQLPSSSIWLTLSQPNTIFCFLGIQVGVSSIFHTYPSVRLYIIIFFTYSNLSCNLLVCERSVTDNEPRLGDRRCSRTDLATFTQTNASHIHTNTLANFTKTSDSVLWKKNLGFRTNLYNFSNDDKCSGSSLFLTKVLVTPKTSPEFSSKVQITNSVT